MKQNRHGLTLRALSSNMPVCYHRVCNFVESRRRRISIFPWCVEQERMQSKPFRSWSGREVKKNETPSTSGVHYGSCLLRTGAKVG